MNEEEKQEILGNIEMIIAKDLANYIISNQISIEEMMETGELDVAKRIEISNIAETEINRIKKEEEERERTRFEIEYKIRILKNIKENFNIYMLDVILEFLEKEIITKEELINIGIPKIIIQNLNTLRIDLIPGNIPDTIEKGYTEVYLWGLPGSGKTCALSAILSTGVRLGDIDSKDHYMNQLSNVFLNKFSVLPTPNQQEYIQYLPFDLNVDDNVSHPIALFEMPGAIFSLFHKFNEENIDQFQPINDRLKQYLNSRNKKIHFFIIDITNTKPDRENVTQQQYLINMIHYLDHNNIFNSTTDVVYIITTKSDMLSENVSERKKIAIEHLNENYLSFINSLKNLLSKNKLLESLNVIPFSLGNVYFNELCYFEDSSSKEIIDLLKNNVKTARKSTLFSIINNLFTK